LRLLQQQKEVKEELQLLEQEETETEMEEAVRLQVEVCVLFAKYLA
jgi:hypothetical protein